MFNTEANGYQKVICLSDYYSRPGVGWFPTVNFGLWWSLIQLHVSLILLSSRSDICELNSGGDGLLYITLDLQINENTKALIGIRKVNISSWHSHNL